jgi:pantoate--beta-alanine ligase
MRILTDPSEVQTACLTERCSGRSLALVPTMGYYHEGHLSLMRWARQNADTVAVSLFVNPTQFGPGEDLESYPRDFERDCRLAEAEGVDLLFAPQAQDVYKPDHATWVEVPALSRNLCGKSRPEHFRGVCTVVTKLFNLMLPHTAVFGRKDWQQLAIIKRLVHDLNLPVRVEGRPIVREPDGLAMSSRNVYLSPGQRQEAVNISRGLTKAMEWVTQGCTDPEALLGRLAEFYAQQIPSGRIDYLELVHPESLEPVNLVQGNVLLAVAVRIGQARLIDNSLMQG